MAYRGQYGGGGPGPQRPPPQRQFPPGPGGPQHYSNAPPPPPPQQHHYDHYQDGGHGYGYDDYGNGYDQGYAGQYDDMSYGRGRPPAHDYHDYPPHDYYDPGPNGPGRGGRPMPGGRGGPMRPPPPGEGGRGGGPYPPRGGGFPPGPGARGFPPPGHGGRPGPPERSANSDPAAGRRPPPMGGPGPMGGGDPGFEGPFPTFPGTQRRSDRDTEQQIMAQMEGLDISGSRPGPRGPPPQRGPMRPPPNGYGGPGPGPGPVPGPGPGGPGPGPMGPPRRPPQPYHPHDYPDQRRGPPPGPGGYGPPGGHPDEGFGPPPRSMTVPARDGMDMGPGGPPIRRDSAPYNGPIGRGMPPRPSTAQGMRQPPPRIHPPNNGAPVGAPREPPFQNEPDSGHANQERPSSIDNFYDYYGDSNDYPEQNPPSATSELPDFGSISSQKPRSSFDAHMQAGFQEQAQRGPARYPEVSRAKSQPDLRNSQTAVFEMAGDIPPLPTQRGPPPQQAGPPPQGRPDGPQQFQRSPPPGHPGHPDGPQPFQRSPPPGHPDGPQQFQRSPPPGQPGPPPGPGPGLPPGPAPYHPPPPMQAGAPHGGPNPDSLPSHPTPVRPGHMPGSLVNLNDRPPPVRNYSGTPSYGSSTPAPPAGAYAQGPPHPQQPGGGNPPAAKQAETPVTVEELEHLRAVVKNDPSDQATALRLAKRLVEASDALVPNLPDPKARARSRERYLVDAQKILKKLEKANNPDAMFFLADCLGRGIFGGEPDNAHAFSLYQSAAKLGHAAAAYRTAVCCEIGNDEGGGTRKDPLKAIQWYKRAATLGDTPAMYKVGMILLKGLLGQPRNPREAISWLKRAAERADAENPHALHELALLYESAEPNDVILRDEAYALQLFKQAAELGYKFSQFRLGCAYEYGLLGCPIDPRLSIMWYSRAAVQEEHQSELALSGWYLTGSDGVLQQSDTEAYLWARKAALAGLAKAEYAMGYYTEVGIGVPANLEDAKRWYWRAAAQDYPKARERLEDLKRVGKNGPRQREKITRSKIGKQQEGECSVM